MDFDELGNGNFPITSDTLAALKRKCQEAQTAVNRCNRRDVVLLLGDAHCGKSTLLNYLVGASLREYTNEQMKTGGLLRRMYIDVDQTNDQISQQYSPIGHGRSPQSVIPFAAEVDGLVICEIPAANEHGSIDQILADACNLRDIMNSAQSCRIVIVVPFSDIEERKDDSLIDICSVIYNMFKKHSSLERNMASVSFCVSHLPDGNEDDFFHVDELRDFLAKSDSSVIRTICRNTFLAYDPLNRTDRLYGPILSREDLLQKLKLIPSVMNHGRSFQAGLSESQVNIIKKLEDNVFHAVKTLFIENSDTEAARRYHLFTSLECNDIGLNTGVSNGLKNRMKELFTEMGSVVEAQIRNVEDVDAKRMIEEYGDVMKLFCQDDSAVKLERLWQKYKVYKIRQALTRGAIVGGASLGVGLGLSALFPPIAVGATIVSGIGAMGICIFIGYSTYQHISTVPAVSTQTQDALRALQNESNVDM